MPGCLLSRVKYVLPKEEIRELLFKNAKGISHRYYLLIVRKVAVTHAVQVLGDHPGHHVVGHILGQALPRLPHRNIVNVPGGEILMINFSAFLLTRNMGLASTHISNNIHFQF